MAHIDRRGKGRDGRMRYRVRYRAPDSRERSRTFFNLRDAEQFEAQCELDRARGLWIDPSLGKRRLAEYADKWLSGQGHLANRTRQKVAGHLRNHIVPGFGPFRLNAIQAEDVREWLVGLTVDPSTANAILGTLTRVLETATRDGVLPRNPCAHVDRLAEGAMFEARFLSAEQVNELASAIAPRYRALVLLAAYSGLRWGELAALRTADVDFLNGVVVVERSMESPGDRPVFKRPKSGKARSVTIPRGVAQVVGEHIGQHPGDVDAVFTSPSGRHLDHSNFYPRDFRPAVKRALGLPTDFRFHDLRHTSVALAIKLGAHPKQIQERLGHSTIRLTLDRYGHLFPTLDETLQERLDATFSDALAASSRSGASPSIAEIPVQRAD